MSQRVTLTIPEHLAHALADAAGAEVESAGLLLAGQCRTPRELRLLGREIAWVPADAYRLRTRDGLLIDSAGWVPALGRSADDDAVPMFVHTHPGGDPAPSDADQWVADQMASVVAVRTGRAEHGTLVISPDRGGFSFTGLLRDRRGERPIQMLRVVGDRLRFVMPFGSPSRPAIAAAFDRSVRAFGPDLQVLLGQLHAGVVGHGGTGSAITEQLLRLGFGAITVFDDQLLVEHNVPRVYGAGLRHVGSSKVQIARSNGRRIGLGARVSGVARRITEREAARRLRDCDVVFGCTDDHAGRAILSRLAYRYLIPVVDMGFLISSRDGEIHGLDGRVTTLVPGTPCLLCRGSIDPARMRFESLTPDARKRLAREGYAPELGDPDPAVVAYTTLVASLAINELLERLIGFGGEAPPSEILIRAHERQISRNRRPARPGCYCAESTRWARGDEEPFLGISWPD